MSEYIENRQHRKQALKKLILDLHSGLGLADARSRFSALVGDVSAVEIAQLEQELIADGRSPPLSTNPSHINCNRK